MSNVVNAENKFIGDKPEYIVTIEVTVTWKFIKAVMYCFLHSKILKITHTFTNDPFAEGKWQDWNPVSLQNLYKMIAKWFFSMTLKRRAGD